MYKEYFTIMSYDDERPINGVDTYAQTPMILYVIALQDAYGAGGGTSGNGNDTITVGGTGVNAYRTYFDTGGIDTINLVNYSSGVYLHMGTTILGASHLVGVSMSMADHQLMVSGGSPQSLRWFYGEYENATGSAGSDYIIGNGLNNAITATSGNDTIDGGGGIDTVIFGAKLSEFTGTIGTQTVIQDNILSRYGKETFTNIERLKFTDTSLALDISKDQTAGSSYMLYKAAFNRAPDTPGLGFWINKMDGGMSYDTVAQNFVNSQEFKTAYGGSNPTVNTLVTKLYNNVLTRNPDGGGLAFWQEKLSTGGWTVANVLGYFATSAENVTNVTPLIAQGILYQEWIG
jgi:hypothetical protein